MSGPTPTPTTTTTTMTTTECSTIDLTSTQTALALIPPAHFHSAINTLRSTHDRRHKTWPAHITLLFPFVASDSLPDAVSTLRSAFVHEPMSSFDVALTGTGVFEHSKNATVFLKPDDAATTSLSALRQRVLASLGADEKETFCPHLTIGQVKLETGGGTGDEVAALVQEAGKLVVMGTISWTVDRVAVMRRENGVVRCVDEVMIDGRESTFSNHSVRDLLGAEETGVRQCYGFSDNEWMIINEPEGYEEVEAAAAAAAEAEEEEEVVIATYNVLCDSSTPDLERYPKTVATIVAAQADILSLQEITPHFLNYLLSHPEIQRAYPYVSHAATTPLPSLRNCIILSTRPFKWEWLPFTSKHKGAVVAHFGKKLVVASVHLTCGLSETSVAAKRAQMSTLQRASAKNWVVAGDFNLATSSKTIEVALESGKISGETAEVVREGVISSRVWGDAWADAEEKEKESSNVEDGMYPGEEGATFDRQSNPLAARDAREGADTRPQRYDRVLFRRDDGGVGVKTVSRFGLPDQHGAVASDHYGVRAVFSLNPTPPSPKIAVVEVEEEETERIPVAPPQDLLFAPRPPSAEANQRRVEAITELKTRLCGETNLQLELAPLGSYALGCHSESSDIDLLCMSPISRKTFFQLARQRLRGLMLRYVPQALVPMLELRINGIKIDLQYVQAPVALLERWSKGIHYRDDEDEIWSQLSPPLLRSLSAWRDMQHIKAVVPDMDIYRRAHRALRYWMQNMGIYSARFGLLGGVHLSLMLSRVAQLTDPDVSAQELVGTFVAYYAKFPWATSIVSDPHTHGSYARVAREAVVILGVHRPAVRLNVAQNATRLTAETLKQEFLRPLESGQLFLKRPGGDVFVGRYKSYIKIGINFWGPSKSRLRGLVGWVESRCPLFLVDVGQSLPNVDARIWPGRFCDPADLMGTAASGGGGGDFHGFYLIGVKSTSTTPESKKAVLGKLSSLRYAFETQLRDTKLFDETEAWITVEHVSRRELYMSGGFLNQPVMDTRDWGGDADPEILEDEKEDDELLGDDEQDDDATTVAGAVVVERRGVAVVAGAKLRPAHDVLHRLRWDPAIDADDYVIGYEDRFVGIKEFPMAKWTMEKTDREFIPMHRVMYFKKKGGEKIWDREGRVDLVFGTGVSSVEEEA